MSELCSICLIDLTSEPFCALPCIHRFHSNCLWTLYRACKNSYDEEHNRILRPNCPLCRTIFHSKDLPSRVIYQRSCGRPSSELQHLLTEPAYASFPPSDRPLRLTRRLVIVEREERQRALDALIAERDRLLSSHEVISEPTPSPLSIQAAPISVSQTSTSSGSTAIAPGGNFRPILESDDSSASCSSQPVLLSLSSKYQRGSNLIHLHQGVSSQQAGPKLQPESDRSTSAPPCVILGEPNQVAQPPLGSSQNPIELLSQSQESGPKLQVKTEIKVEPSATPIFHVRLMPQPKLEPKIEAEVQNLQRQISIASTQLLQMQPYEGGQNSSDSPPHAPDEDSGDEDDASILPVAILGTWARGRHMRYRIRWSDGSEGYNRTKDVERAEPNLLANFRRELRRLATARTRQNQAAGLIPKIPGRGRGRGRGSK